mgnify:CR=1 FL=1
MNKKLNPFSLRVETTILLKTKIIAEKNSRSINKEIEYLMKKNIDEFEKAHGTIHLSDDLDSSI